MFCLKCSPRCLGPGNGNMAAIKNLATHFTGESIHWYFLRCGSTLWLTCPHRHTRQRSLSSNHKNRPTTRRNNDRSCRQQIFNETSWLENIHQQVQRDGATITTRSITAIYWRQYTRLLMKPFLNKRKTTKAEMCHTGTTNAKELLTTGRRQKEKWNGPKISTTV